MLMQISASHHSMYMGATPTMTELDRISCAIVSTIPPPPQSSGATPMQVRIVPFGWSETDEEMWWQNPHSTIVRQWQFSYADSFALGEQVASRLGRTTIRKP